MGSNKSAVLVTGASTGIGESAVHALARQGYQVFACARNDSDLSRLQSSSPEIQGLILDVTNPDQIKTAFKKVSSFNFEKFHLINNAGIAVPGPIEVLSMEELRSQFDVNFFGLLEVTKTFIPILRKTKGRILNISSVSGLSSAPFLGAYSASKFALEAISDSLRWELAPSGIKVILIEPGPILTPIWQKSLSNEAALEKFLSTDEMINYKKPMEKFVDYAKLLEKNAIPVERVTKAISYSLKSPRPPARIVVASPKAKFELMFKNFAPQKWVDKAVNTFIFK